MFTYLCILALLPLSSWEYKIKVEGKLDIGNQIAKFLKEVRARVLEQKMRAIGQKQFEQENESKTDLDAQYPNTQHKANKKPIARQKDIDMPSIAELRDKDDQEPTLLDDMIKKGEKKMHVYGEHESDEPTERNKVNV